MNEVEYGILVYVRVISVKRFRFKKWALSISLFTFSGLNTFNDAITTRDLEPLMLCKIRIA